MTPEIPTRATLLDYVSARMHLMACVVPAATNEHLPWMLIARQNELRQLADYFGLTDELRRRDVPVPEISRSPGARL